MFHATQASSPGAELALVDRTLADPGRAVCESPEAREIQS
ncbi:MAG: hypothetical protein QOD10_2029 [Mycobacterium sp.]|nr:hypothetical protein [Mycobacterium sp.]